MSFTVSLYMMRSGIAIVNKQWRHNMPPPLSSPVGPQRLARRRADAT